ncbi:MAG TPA: hypothetical protein VD767_04670, partial [Thermomicrobiales bacterium]|nr:hypothetical protein [Thermomicrobiales bacterium]
MTHTPLTDPDDNDPAAGRVTDATADALDALLNRIAQSPGSPASRTGRGNDGPDAWLDANASDEDLLVATRAFHRRFSAAEARSPGASGPSPHLWEQIMQQSPTPAYAGQRTAATGQTIPPSRGGGLAAPRRARSRFAPRSLTVLSNATLALLLILTALGGWRAWDTMRGTGTADPEPTATGWAMIPATPDDAAPAVETPEPAFDCDFSRDIPIFHQVNESPVDGTALVLTIGGDLLLSCPEEPEPIVLASGVTAGQVGPPGYPGLVTFSTPETGTTPAFVTYLNIFTGASVRAGLSQEGMRMPSLPNEESPWLVANSYDTPGTWEITDLRTMESRTLN